MAPILIDTPRENLSINIYHQLTESVLNFNTKITLSAFAVINRLIYIWIKYPLIFLLKYEFFH